VSVCLGGGLPVLSLGYANAVGLKVERGEVDGHPLGWRHARLPFRAGQDGRQSNVTIKVHIAVGIEVATVDGFAVIGKVVAY